MKSLNDFLNCNVAEGLTKEVAISKRFKDDGGKLLKFTIRALNTKEFDEIRNKSTVIDGKGNRRISEEKFDLNIILAGTANPNFKDAESHKVVGVSSSENYINKVLLAGEVAKLAKEIASFSGFADDFDELVEEAKN